MLSNGSQNNGKNGHQPSPSSENEWLSVVDRLRIMRRDGWEQELDSGRKVRLQTLEPHVLLRDDQCPDILTPYLVRSLYGAESYAPRPTDFEVDLEDKQAALKYYDMIRFIVAKSIADDTDVDDLTIQEKKFIFRLALAGAELLVSFRYPSSPDVDAVEESDHLPQATE